MTQDQIILFSLFGIVFAMLLWGRFRYDLVAFTALMAGVVLGVVPTADAFSGFGHPATIIVALVLVVSAGLVRSGAVYLITRTLVDASRSLGAHIAIMGAIGGVLSAFMNNVAALALLMPVDMQTARKAGRTAGLSLMPLSFATILGGMVTLIGTPPNIIIASIREETLGAPFKMFDFAPVGGIAALAGLAFVALVGWRLIPAPDGKSDGKGLDSYTDYFAELTIPDGSKLIGKRVSELYDDAEKNDVAILGLIRDGKRRYGTARNISIEAQDTLVLEAAPEALDEFRTALNLDFSDAKREELLAATDGLSKIEVVATETSRITGKTAQAIGLRRTAPMTSWIGSGACPWPIAAWLSLLTQKSGLPLRFLQGPSRSPPSDCCICPSHWGLLWWPMCWRRSCRCQSFTLTSNGPWLCCWGP